MHAFRVIVYVLVDSSKTVHNGDKLWNVSISVAMRWKSCDNVPRLRCSVFWHPGVTSLNVCLGSSDKHYMGWPYSVKFYQIIIRSFDTASEAWRPTRMHLDVINCLSSCVTDHQYSNGRKLWVHNNWNPQMGYVRRNVTRVHSNTSYKYHSNTITTIINYKQHSGIRLLHGTDISLQRAPVRCLGPMFAIRANDIHEYTASVFLLEYPRWCRWWLEDHY